MQFDWLYTIDDILKWNRMSKVLISLWISEITVHYFAFGRKEEEMEEGHTTQVNDNASSIITPVDSTLNVNNNATTLPSITIKIAMPKPPAKFHEEPSLNGLF